LVDTLFDLRHTRDMLEGMRRAVPAAKRIGTLVNTHANGDHCYGNQLLAGARIVASDATAAEMSELPPSAMAALVAQAPQMGALGEFFLRCFGSFEFDGIEPTLPSETFSGDIEVAVGDVRLELIEVGPAHTRGDTIVHAPAARVLFSGDILFSGAHPIAWAGPVSHWIAACERILALDPAVIVPGHGPLAGTGEVHELKAYFEYLYDHARVCHDDGMTALQAARAISRDRWADWGERERLVVNVANIYAEIDGTQPPNPLEAFQQMAELAGDRTAG
jgi:glyoxylase-like metal-dependent hydrolase (beta-lactamase superfamily II)